MRKERTKNKAYARGTGGGQYVSPPPAANIEEEMELLKNYRSQYRVEGLTNVFDSDGLAGKSIVTYKN